MDRNRNLASSIVALAVLSLLLAMPFSQTVGTAGIRAPAVIVANDTGSLTPINLTVTHGTGIVNITGPTGVGNDTLQSAQEAAAYAARYLNLSERAYNFDYNIANSTNVSGPSAGAAMTVLAISALSHTPLLTNFTMTGTIDGNGTIGPIGGIYEKASAAKAAGLSFILAPSLGNQSPFTEEYVLVEDTLGIPVVPVANISQAFGFATSGSASAYRASYEAYTQIDTAALPAAQIQCSNGCNITFLQRLSNKTFSLTNASISQLARSPGFANVYLQLFASLNQSRALAGKGYYYAGSNDAFLAYLQAFYFNSHSLTIPGGYSTMQNITKQCYFQSIPTMTDKNYEMILGGELRQAWGEFTSNGTLSVYNNTVQIKDDMLDAMRQASEASGWCSASQWMYSLAQDAGGAPVSAASNLSSIASARISSAADYGPGMYLITAEQAMQVNNYPLAILDADYAFAINNASDAYSLPANTLIQMAAPLAKNATFGVWASQYANEAYMYISASTLAGNQSLAHTYAEQAYSAALLASKFSTDMRLINASFSPGITQQQINSQSSPVSATAGQSGSGLSQSSINNYILQSLGELSTALSDVYAIVIVLSVIVVVFLMIILYLLLPSSKAARMHLRKAEQERGQSARQSGARRRTKG